MKQKRRLKGRLFCYIFSAVREKVFDLLESRSRRIFGGSLNEDNIAEIRSCLENYRHPLYKKIESLTEVVLSEADDASLNEEQEKIRN